MKGEQERVSQVTKTLEESDKETKETITRIQGTQEDMNKTIVETTKGVEGLQSTVSDIKKDQNGITDRVVKQNKILTVYPVQLSKSTKRHRKQSKS